MDPQLSRSRGNVLRRRQAACVAGLPFSFVFACAYISHAPADVRVFGRTGRCLDGLAVVSKSVCEQASQPAVCGTVNGEERGHHGMPLACMPSSTRLAGALICF